MRPEIEEMYRKAFQEHGRDPASVLCPKGRQRLRFAAMLDGVDVLGKTILDFGCGLGDLLPFWKELGGGEYRGVDMVDEFIESNVSVHGDCFEVISSVSDIDFEADIILASGVFNIVYDQEESRHIDEVFAILDSLWEKTRHLLVVDFLSDMVDFKVEGAFHYPSEAAIGKFKSHFGRRITLNHSYLPFEYCVRAFKCNEIESGGSVYINDV